MAGGAGRPTFKIGSPWAAQSALSPLGLLAEDYETTTLRMWGNFPQAYSHVGLIHAAFAASPRWSEIL